MPRSSWCLGLIAISIGACAPAPSDGASEATGDGSTGDEVVSGDGDPGDGDPTTGDGDPGDGDPTSGDGDGDGDPGDGDGDPSGGVKLDVLGGDGDGDPGGLCQPMMPAQDAVDCAQYNIQLAAPYDQNYECFVLGEVPGVPFEWGGINLDPGDENRLLIGGDANESIGKFYSIGIARDGLCHIRGFDGSPTTLYSDGGYNDGGIVFHPDTDVMLYARWPVNELGQIVPGNALTTDKIIGLDAFGVANSHAALNFVPPSFANEGALKLVSWPGGEWYEVELAPDNMGTYDVLGVTPVTTIPGGPEGFVYIPDTNDDFDVDSILVADWSENQISAYEIDGQGDPIVNTRALFVDGFDGAEGAFVDPLSGDFVFATWSGVNLMIAIQGFLPPPQ